MRARLAASRLLVPLVLASAGMLAGPARAASPARTLDAADAALAAGHPAAAESLASTALGTLERASHPDSLALARAWSVAARARIERGHSPDSTLATRTALAAGVLERRLPAGDPRLVEAYETAGLVFASRASADDHARAAAWWRRAIAARHTLGADPDTALATALHRLARLETGRTGADSARTHLEQALAIRERAGGSSAMERARLHRELAELAALRKDFPNARAELEAAIAEAERAGGHDTPELIPILQTDAQRLVDSDQAGLSVAPLLRALTIARATWGDDDDRTLLIHGSVASRYLILGDPQRGRRELLDVESRLAAKPHPDTLKLAAVRFVLSGTWVERGDTASAVPWIEKAVRDYESVGHLHDRLYLYALSTLSRWYESRAPAHAESLVTRAIALDRDRPGSPDAATGTLVGQECRMLLQRERYAEMVALSDTLIRRLVAAGLGRSVAITHGYHWRYWAELALGRTREAYDTALLLSAVERTNTTRTMRGMTEPAAFDLEQHRSEPLDWLLIGSERFGGGTTVSAWTELTRWRGLVRHELSLRRLGVTAGADTALDVLRARWTRAQDEWARTEVRAPGRADDRLRQRADDARREYLVAAAAMLSRLPDDSLDIRLVAGTLHPGQALVSYYEIAPGSDTARVGVLVWRAGEGAPHQRTLGVTPRLASLDAAWDALLQSPGEHGATADANAERRARAAGLRVRAAVWDPIAAWVGDAHEVFVVPAGPVQDLHWPALPWDVHAYWAERGPVVRVLNSERELLAPPLAPAPGGLLAFGGIDYALAPAPTATPAMVAARFRHTRRDCRDGVPPHFEPLPATGREAAAVAAAWPAGAGEPRVLHGADATESAFRRLAHGYRALHLATHGYVPRDTCASADTTLRGIGSVSALSAPAPRAAASGGGAPAAPAALKPGPTAQDSTSVVWLAFAGADHAAEHDSGDDDGLLTPEEVATLDLGGTGWVVLSSCYATAGREDWAREGLSGMRRAFHMAGARTVIGSSWPVSDEATAEWMSALYAARAAGASSPGAAIQKACATVLAARRRAGRTTHPFYWATFTSTGE